MTEKELNTIIENHKHWLNEDCAGWDEMRADSTGANFAGANLRSINLSGAILKTVNLESADLANANLTYANLTNSNLSNVNLAYANLTGVNFTDSNLAGVNLTYANLARSNFYRADLAGANLTGANLKDADLRGAKNIPFIPLACPDIGTFTAYKKVRGYIVKLQIPEDAKRLSATGRKCRCDKAQVLEIQYLDGKIANIIKIESDHDKDFIYEVGKTVLVDNFDEDRWNECSTGIHFFVNRQEAVEY